MPGTRGDDEHVRALLDQRAQRADVPPPHTRFSIFSDRSDSPSLYSHFDNTYRNTPTTPAPRFPRLHDNNAFNDRHEPYPPLSPKERLADPNASSLDLSEDTDAYSESSSRVVDPEDDSNLNPDDDDEDPETRLSLMGPKMRVHSRAPWEEEDEDTASDEDSDDGGNDTSSAYGGKKPGLTVMRGLGFGSRSPAPRSGFDPSFPTKDKRSFDTTSSATASGSSRSAVQALAQASMSSTSLAIRPSSPASRIPHKLSIGRLALNRDRSASGPASAFDANSMQPALRSPRSDVHTTEQPMGRESPYGRRKSVSSDRSELTASVVRTRSPSPISPADSTFTHPYANPALLSAYRHVPVKNQFNRGAPEAEGGHIHVTRNDSVVTLATSEETVMLSNSSSTTSASMTSTSGLEASTPPTSDFSLVSSASKNEPPKLEDSIREAEEAKHQKRLRRETKLGPISGPISVRNKDFAATTPYTLISLEQAQARAKERNRSATTGAVTFPTGALGENVPEDIAPRARSTSINAKSKHYLPHLMVDNDKLGTDTDVLFTPVSLVSGKQPSPIGPPAGKTVRAKRSGFMKLFNGRDRDKPAELPPPLPKPDAHTSSQSPDQYSNPPFTARPIKISSHRVPVPAVSASPQAIEGKGNLRSKKSGPPLSIRVSSPPSSHALEQDIYGRRSDSPKTLQPPMSPRMPSSAPADMTQFPALRLRPVSSFFSSNFEGHLLTEVHRPGSPRGSDVSSLISPTTIASSDLIPSPVNAGFHIGSIADSSHGYSGDRASTFGENDDQTAVVSALKEQIRTSRKTWQRQIWELEGQVRDLRAEIDDLKSGEVCEKCGRGDPCAPEKRNYNIGVIHRPRAKTGHGARFASGNDS